MRESVRVVCAVIAICIPFACLSQTVAATPPSPLREIPPDTAKRLEGRLFFSPEERKRMNDARKRGLAPGDDGQFVEPLASVLNGFVKRSDGNIAVWVDGVPRWNAKSKNTDGLLPSDVGGPASYLKASSGETVAPMPMHTMRAKKVVKPRVKKNATRRPLR